MHEVGFSDQLTNTLIQLVAQDTVNRLTPFIESIAQQIQQGGETAGADAAKVSDGIEKASKALQGAIESNAKSVQADLKKTAKAITDAQAKDLKALQGGLSKALGGMDFPDYSEQLTQIAAAQPVILSAIKDNEPEESPKEWDFDIKRNSNGFIQSVTAKAK